MSNDSMAIGVTVTELSGAVLAIKTAILQSQGRAARGVNQEQLALYYGIGRFISVNTRKRNWGASVIDGISERLRVEMPGLRGFSGRNLKNMRAFYEAWNMLEPNSAVQTAELPKDDENLTLPAEIDEFVVAADNSAVHIAEIQQLKLTNLPDFPLAEFLSIGFTHHIQIIEGFDRTEYKIFAPEILIENGIGVFISLHKAVRLQYVDVGLHIFIGCTARVKNVIGRTFI